MRIIAITLVTLFISSFAIAQSKHQLDAETQGGYEYNYFKSPRQISQNGDLLTEDDLISSSLYQDVTVDYDYRYKWNQNRIRFSITPRARVFYESTEDSYWQLNATAKYDYKFNRNTKLLLEGGIKRMNRKGLDGAQDILVNPLGYTNFGLSGGVEFSPFANNETSVEAFYNFKDFDAFGSRDLQFNEFGLLVKTAQEFESNGLEHRYGLSAYVKKRNYDTFNASDVIVEGKRDWDYVRANAFYELPLSKTLEVEPSFLYYVRIDNNNNNQSGFTMYGPKLGLKYDNDKTKVRTAFSFVTRNYASLEARDSEEAIGEKIQYQYAEFTLDAEHQLNDHLFITANIYSRVRSTNYTDLAARSFRGYRHQYAGLGIKWEF